MDERALAFVDENASAAMVTLRARASVMPYVVSGKASESRYMRRWLAASAALDRIVQATEPVEPISTPISGAGPPR